MGEGPGKSPDQAVVVMAPNWLGDMVMALPALWAIKRGLRIDEVSVHLPENLVELLDRQAFRRLPWRKEDGLLDRVSRVRAGGYELAVILPNSFKSALIPFLARVPQRLGYRTQGRALLLTFGIRRTSKQVMHESTRFMRVVEGFIPSTRFRLPRLTTAPKDRQWAEDALVAADIGDGDLLVGLFPGAKYGPAKRWLPERFAQLACALHSRLQARILLMGGREERRFVGEMARTLPIESLDLSGRTTLGQLMALLERCNVLVSNDTGPMHLASAVGTPVVAIFGSTDPRRTAPLGPHRVIRHELDCSPCFKRRCPLGTYACLHKLRVEEVLEGVQRVLGGKDHAVALEGM